MAYQGYLLKVGNTKIPHSYMRAETYKALLSTNDLDSYRDANGKLHRNALEHRVGKVEFETPPLMDNKKMTNFLKMFQNNYIDVKEKAVNATFYVPELDDYLTQKMYVPDINFTLYFADEEKVQYNQTRIALIAY